MKTYFDTSHLVAFYVPQVHTAAALRFHTRLGRQPIPFTPLHRLELRTAIRQCANNGLLTIPAARQILCPIQEDLDDGTLVHQGLDWTESLQQAETIGELRAWSQPCRSLDLWHVAAAIESQAEAFVTFDQDQLALAQAQGLRAVLLR